MNGDLCQSGARGIPSRILQAESKTALAKIVRYLAIMTKIVSGGVDERLL